MNNSKVINLTDIIDINFLQELQDIFSESTGIASLAVDRNGPITKPSGFTAFCANHIRANKLGEQRCIECDIKGDELAVEKGKPIIYKCHTGLTHFVVPIIVGGKHIASILGGQILTAKPDKKHFKNIAKGLGIANKKKYFEDLKRIKIVPTENIQSIIRLLSIITNSISKIAYKNYELIEKNKREKLTGEIVKTIRSTLDTEEIKKYFIGLTQEYFEVDRCLFSDYNRISGKFEPFSLEKLKNYNIESLIGVDLEENFPEFCTKLKKGKDIIIKDLEKTLLKKDSLNYKSLRTLQRGDTKSDYGLLVKCMDQIVGVLVLHFIKEKKVLNYDEFNFLKIIREHAGTALCQSKLYEITKKQAEREFLLRRITKTIRSTLDIEETQRIIVDIIGKCLNADRCFITEYNEKKDVLLQIKYEYLSSNNVKSYKGYDSNIVVPQFVEAFKQGKSLLINNKKIFLDIKNQNENFQIERKAIEDFNVYSALSCPIIYKNEKLGVFSVHYVKEHFINEDEISLIKTISSQVAIAIYQARLYTKIQQQVKREELLRAITTTIRSSLNFEETKKQIVSIIGKTLNADRCFILEYNKSNDKFLIVNEEYLSSDNILSYKGVNLNEHIPSLLTEFKKGKKLIINEGGSSLDGEKIDFSDDKFEDVRNSLNKYKINSALVFPIFYSDEFLGDLVLHYVDLQHEIGDEEIKFLNLLSNQIALALHQAQLYGKIQLQAERERISRNIIEILRSTLDKNMIEHLFVRNIGKYFNADRVFFSEFDNKTGKYMPILQQSEYLSNIGEKSYSNHDFLTSEMGEHIYPLLDKREIIIPDWSSYIEKNNKTPELVDFYKNANVKSSYSFPVLYEGSLLGFFGIEFTQRITELMEEDVNRLRSICTQAGIALYHAELYLEAQNALQEKRELIIKVKNGIEKPVDDIIKTSKVLSELELARDKQKEYLNNIISSCNTLLELTKNISEID